MACVWHLACNRLMRSLVVRQGMGLTLLGVATGLFAGLARARYSGNFVTGVKPTNPSQFHRVCSVSS